MRCRKQTGLASVGLLGGIATSVLLAALLFTTLAQARHLPDQASSLSDTSLFATATRVEAPLPGCVGMESALTGHKGETLTLDSRGGTNIPTLKPAGPAVSAPLQFRVFRDGRIQNVLMGDKGFLTRDSSESGRISVRFATWDPNNKNQVWHFAMGPKLPEDGQPWMERYTLVVAPVSADQRSIWLLTASRSDKRIVIKKRHFPIADADLEQLPLGQRWRFVEYQDLQTQRWLMERWQDLPRPYVNTRLLVQNCLMRNATDSELLPNLISSRTRSMVCDGGANTNHVPYKCTDTYKNIACGLNNRPWIDCVDIAGSTMKQCSHS